MADRRYGVLHRRKRRALAGFVAAGLAICWRCGEAIRAGDPWHLGHDDDGVRHRGPEHELCNLRAAGQASHGRRRLRTSRRWL